MLQTLPQPLNVHVRSGGTVNSFAPPEGELNVIRNSRGLGFAIKNVSSGVSAVTRFGATVTAQSIPNASVAARRVGPDHFCVTSLTHLHVARSLEALLLG